jgi:hypothetical protein
MWVVTAFSKGTTDLPGQLQDLSAWYERFQLMPGSNNYHQSVLWSKASTEHPGYAVLPSVGIVGDCG